jgi:archaellum biogenesis ATPase FlaH
VTYGNTGIITSKAFTNSFIKEFVSVSCMTSKVFLRAVFKFRNIKFQSDKISKHFERSILSVIFDQKINTTTQLLT